MVKGIQPGTTNNSEPNKNDFEELRSMSKKDEEKVEYENPTYGAGKDIYSNEEGVKNSITGDEIENADSDINLGIPGADLDDAGEEIGEEDEENNYYSPGGDDHNDLV